VQPAVAHRTVADRLLVDLGDGHYLARGAGQPYLVGAGQFGAADSALDHLKAAIAAQHIEQYLTGDAGQQLMIQRRRIHSVADQHKDVQYQQLYTQWQQLDSQSALLLRGCRHGTASFNQQSSGTSDSTTLNIEQAAQVLGIERTASRDEIVAAHRRLIQRLHPDRGGSDYLAAQINQAKQVLLDAATNAS
jgi:hypothetical protein